MEPTGAFPQSFTQTHEQKQEKMGVATSLPRVAPQRDCFSEFLRRGGQSSCLHVHVPPARVARGSDPCLQRLSPRLRAGSTPQLPQSSTLPSLSKSSLSLFTPTHTHTRTEPPSFYRSGQPPRLGRGKLSPIPFCTQIGHRSVRFLGSFATATCTFSRWCRYFFPRLHPSLGERLLPHGARSMASAVDSVALV